MSNILVNLLNNNIKSCDEAILQIEKEAAASPELNASLARTKRELLLNDEVALEGCSNPEQLMQALITDLNSIDFGTDVNFLAIARDEIKSTKDNKDTSTFFADSAPKSNISPSKTRAKNPSQDELQPKTNDNVSQELTQELAARLKSEAGAEE